MKPSFFSFRFKTPYLFLPDQSGFLLVTVMLILILMAVSIFSINYYSTVQQRMAANHEDMVKNQFKQYAVLQHTLWEVLSDPCFRTASDGETMTFEGTSFTRKVLDSQVVNYEDVVMIRVQAQGATTELTRGYHYFCERIDIELDTALDRPYRLALDTLGNMYICDTGNHRILKRDSTGNVTVFAGTGAQGFSGDGGAATSALLNTPCGICTDESANVYIADSGNNRVRCIDTSGIITTVAGTGTKAYSGDGGDATGADLCTPYDVAYSPIDNSLFIADTENSCIRKVTSQIISTVAGIAESQGYAGNGGSATNAYLNAPQGVFVTSTGVLYIADTDNNMIRQVDTAGIITTVAGDGTNTYSGDDMAAINASLDQPRDIAVDSSGNLYIADTKHNRVRRVCAQDGIIRTIAGSDQGSIDGVRAVEAQFFRPMGIALLPDLEGKTIYLCDTYNNAIRTLSFQINPLF